ncbi:MAG: hypothetical protein HQK65_11740 [Desulfamplus sp.]|nr:hypothetical protein [Desulfamplus sp.]
MNKCILIHIIRTVGHFQIYALNLTSWALSRRLKVVYHGPISENSIYNQRYASHPSVEFIDIKQSLSFDPAVMPDETIVNELFSLDSAELLLKNLIGLQKSLVPLCTFLINTDNFIFSYPFEKNKITFPTPTYGILTFGNRNYYTGFEEVYSWRLRHMISCKAPFAALFTLDEYHVNRIDPEQKYLKFLPDPCDEFETYSTKQFEKFSDKQPNDQNNHDKESRQCHNNGHWDIQTSNKLASFLDTAEAPVLPIIGKFDDRKNNLAILELWEYFPDIKFVILGQRVPSPEEDKRIDYIFNVLSRQDRIFIKFSFVDQAIFHQLLSHHAVPFVPLPYHAHYGSSGIQLLAMQHHKPTLVPDNGLMGRRVMDTGSGEIFKTGNYQDFRQQCGLMLEHYHNNFHHVRHPGTKEHENLEPCQCMKSNIQYTDKYLDNIKKTMEVFSRTAFHEAIDIAIDPLQTSPPLPFWVQDGKKNQKWGYRQYHSALDAAVSGNHKLAVACLDRALNNLPEHHGIYFKKAVFLLFQKEYKKASKLFSAPENNAEKHFFILRMSEFLSEFPKNSAYPDPIPFIEEVLKHHIQNAETLRAMGIMCALYKKYSLGARAFRQAIGINGNRHDIRLHLSDILRYDTKYKESLDALMELEKIDPNYPGLHYKRGQVFSENGEYALAKKEMKKEVSLNPTTHFSYLASQFMEKNKNI